MPFGAASPKARVSYSALMVDGVTTHLGSASLWAGVGYRFQ